MKACAVKASSTRLTYSTVDALGLEPLAGTDRNRGPRSPSAARIAQQAQAVGDVRRAAAELAAHLGNQKGDVQDMDLVGQDVRLEVVGEHQNRVVGHGSADQCGSSSFEHRRHSHILDG